MFLMNMTNEELVLEYRLDLPEIKARNKAFDSSAYVSKVLRKKRKSEHIGFVRDYVVKRSGNRYLNVFDYHKKADSTGKLTNWEWEVFTIGLFETFKGLCAVMFYDEARIAVVYQAHFFIRYKERLMKECDWKTRQQLQYAKTLIDTMVIFNKRNPSVAWMNAKTKFGDIHHIFAPIDDGAILAQWDGKKLQANTFITKSMYSNQQRDMVDAAQLYSELEDERNMLTEIFFKVFNEKENQRKIDDKL